MFRCTTLERIQDALAHNDKLTAGYIAQLRRSFSDAEFRNNVTRQQNCYHLRPCRYSRVPKSERSELADTGQPNRSSDGNIRHGYSIMRGNRLSSTQIGTPIQPPKAHGNTRKVYTRNLVSIWTIEFALSRLTTTNGLTSALRPHNTIAPELSFSQVGEYIERVILLPEFSPPLVHPPAQHLILNGQFPLG